VLKGIEDGQPLNHYISAKQLKKYVEENREMAVGDSIALSDNLNLCRVEKKK